MCFPECTLKVPVAKKKLSQEEVLEHSFKSGYSKWENFLYHISKMQLIRVRVCNLL